MIKNILLHSSLFLILLIAIVLILSNSLFIMGSHLNVYVAVLSFILSVVIFSGILKNPKDILLGFAAALIVVVVSYFVSDHFFDISFDGQGYHQETVFLLKNGWNPMCEPSGAFRTWIDHYQKGNEIIQANIYLVTNRIESIKLINLLYIYIGFSVLYFFLSVLKFNWFYKVIVAVVTILNPVVFTQVFTNYVDANWYLTLLIAFIALFTYFSKKEKIFLMIFVLSSVIFCTIKFSSIPIYIVCLAFAFLYNWRYVKLKIFPTLLGIGFLVIICSVHPFLTNVKNGHHVFYPFAGPQKIDILNQNIPKSLLNKNRIERLSISLFSKPSNDTMSSEVKTLVWPFSIKKEYLFLNHEMRLGGFGFLFSGTLLISAALGIFLLFSQRDRPYRTAFVFIVLALASSIILNPASWWARLSPQIWLLPIVVFVFGLKYRTALCRLFSKIGVLLLGINMFFPLYYTYLDWQAHRKIMNHFLDEVGSKTIILDLTTSHAFPKYYLKFKERNINYKIERITDRKLIAPFTQDVYYEIQ